MKTEQIILAQGVRAYAKAQFAGARKWREYYRAQVDACSEIFAMAIGCSSREARDTIEADYRKLDADQKIQLGNSTPPWELYQARALLDAIRTAKEEARA